MRKKLIKKSLVFVMALAMISLVFGSIGHAGVNRNLKESTEKNIPQSLNCEVINITVQEAWDMLNDTSNGIQIPIDVRYDYEWYSGFIDTSYPECPIWYTLNLLKNETGLQEFIDLYDGEEVILYCKGGYRSLVGSYILCYSNFTGIIYNMLGGITAWEAAGLPIRNNTPPENPTIDGPLQGTVNKPYDYTFSTIDLQSDVIYFWVEWCSDGCCGEWHGPYESGEEVILTHKWDEKGTHTIKAKAKDFYGNESDWTELEVNMPRNKEYNFFIIEKILKLFSNAFPIIRYIIGL